MYKKQKNSVITFIFLSIISFGLYEMWWMYKAWKFFQQKEKSDIIPAARAIFCIFFLHSLFDKILDYAKGNGYTDSYSSTSLFTGFFVASLLSRLPAPFGMLSILSFVFILSPFQAFNFARQHSTDCNAVEQQSFNGRQIVLIIFGFIFWGMVLLGIVSEQ